jgi:hypothetical protein
VASVWGTTKSYRKSEGLEAISSADGTWTRGEKALEAGSGSIRGGLAQLARKFRNKTLPGLFIEKRATLGAVQKSLFLFFWPIG